MFVSTKPNSYGENRKANIKNYNLPILQEIYHGDANTRLHCVVSKKPAFHLFECLVTGNQKIRFDCDFNHIRQEANVSRRAGTSKDKSSNAPSEIFRKSKLDDSNIYNLVEFLTIMPVCQEIHGYITQDSAIGDITLKNFKKETWPWHLQSKSNWLKVAKKYDFDFIPYEEFLEHLMDIKNPPIQNRIRWDHDNYRYEWLSK